MKTTITRFISVWVSLILINLVNISISLAEIDFNDCVAMLYFNDGTGDVAKDAFGKDNNGKIHGGAKWVNGKFGKGLELDGTDDYVEIAHDDSLMVSGKHTIAHWCKLTSVPAGGMGVVTKDDWAPGFWWDGSIIRHHTHDPPASLY
ncbi:hypothetical protein JT359_07875 [Candidatus Poribacteria bacterium]|nr:hypothetical protein [Candidatus Poribacteria bacterium]